MHVFFMGGSIRTFSQYSRGMYAYLFGFDGWSAIHSIHTRRAIDADARDGETGDETDGGG